MPLIAVGICTYRRPEGLAAALASLDRLRLRDLIEKNVCVVVVDNSPDGSAAQTCHASSSRFEVFYRHEPRKGLSNARNAAIDEARLRGADRLAFLDDDEIADEHWLEELHQRMNTAGSIVTAGPTFPLFAEPPSHWVPIEAYAYVAKERDGIANDASSANMMIDIARLERLGFSFQAEFNETGGEDTQLMSALMAAGKKIAWAEKAIAWDQVPLARMRPLWLFKRWYRTGITESRVLTSAPQSARGRIVNFAKGSVRASYGTLRIGLGAVKYLTGTSGALVASCYTFCRGLGYLSGAAGKSFTEYSVKRYR
jgi:succinoglycan biosynthesis protein ExoM